MSFRRFEVLSFNKRRMAATEVPLVPRGLSRRQRGKLPIVSFGHLQINGLFKSLYRSCCFYFSNKAYEIKACS